MFVKRTLENQTKKEKVLKLGESRDVSEHPVEGRISQKDLKLNTTQIYYLIVLEVRSLT